MKNSIRFLIYIILSISYACEKDEFEVHDSGLFIDKRDNISYNWVRIGKQIWMAENLAYLPSVNSPADTNKNFSQYFVYGYDNSDVAAAKNTANYLTYGVLYNWPAAKKACPEGWALPSDDQWEQLFYFIQEDKLLFNFKNAGKFMKSKGTFEDDSGLWNKSFKEYEGTDDYNFTALPGGEKLFVSFYGLHAEANWWARSKIDTSFVMCIPLYYDSPKVEEHGIEPEVYALSIRCIKK